MTTPSTSPGITGETGPGSNVSWIERRIAQKEEQGFSGEPTDPSTLQDIYDNPESAASMSSMLDRARRRRGGTPMLEPGQEPDYLKEPEQHSEEPGWMGTGIAWTAGLIGGGISDLVGAPFAGAAGLTVLGTEAATGKVVNPETGELEEFYGRENVSNATRAVEGVSELWNKYITENIIGAMLPEDLEDTGTEGYHTIGAAFMKGLDLVGQGAYLLTWPTMETLRQQGVDTTNYEAMVDAHSKATATLYLTVLGMKSLPGMRGGKTHAVSAAEMDMVLGMAADEAAKRFHIDPNRQVGPVLPDYDQFLAGKRTGSPAEEFGAPVPPEKPRTGAGEQMDLGLPEPAINRAPLHEAMFPEHPRSPTQGQMHLPFEEGYPPRPPSQRPLTEYVLEGELIPADAPFQPLSREVVSRILEGEYAVIAGELPPPGPPWKRQLFERDYHGQELPAETFPWRESMQYPEMHGKAPHGGGLRDRPRAETPPPAPPQPKVKSGRKRPAEEVKAEVQARVDKYAEKAAAKKSYDTGEALQKFKDKAAETGPVGKRLQSGEERRAGGAGIPADKFDWRNAREVEAARRHGVDPYRSIGDRGTDVPGAAASPTGMHRTGDLVAGLEEAAKELDRKPRKAPKEEAVKPAPGSLEARALSGSIQKHNHTRAELADLAERWGLSTRGDKAELARRLEKAGRERAQKTRVLNPQRKQKAEKVPGKTRKQQKELDEIYEAHLALVDDLNLRIVEMEMGSGAPVSNMNRGAFLQEVAASAMRELAADMRGLKEAGVPDHQMAAAVAGMAKLRVSGRLQNHANFEVAIQKLLAHPTAQARLMNLAKDTKIAQAVQSALQKLNTGVKYGDRVGLIKQRLQGATLNGSRLTYPGATMASTNVARFTINEVVSLYRELMTAEPGIQVPGRGTLKASQLKKGYETIKQQAVAEWGQRAVNAQEGAISARGMFYNGAELNVIKELIDSVKHDIPAISSTAKVGMDEFSSAMAKTNQHLRPEARKRIALEKKYSLADWGITEAHKPGAKRSNKQQGYLNMEAFNIMDPIARKWRDVSAKKAKKDRAWRAQKKAGLAGSKGQPHRRSADKPSVLKGEMTKGQFLREMIFGGKIIGGLQRKAVRLADKGGMESMRLLAMLDQFPKAMWREGMGQVQSFYQLHMKAFGDLLTDRQNPYSLSAVMEPFQGKFMTGVRRYMRYAPAIGLTMQRLKPKEVAQAFIDVTSGREPVTALGQAFRDHANFAYRYAKENGLETATYLRNWYPVILKGLSEKKREAFRALARSKGIADDQVNHVFDLALDNGGMVDANARPGLNGRHMNAEMRRQFFDKFTMEELRPFIVDDPFRAMYMYDKALARRVANNQRWGKREELWNRQKEAALLEAQELGEPYHLADVATLDAARQILSHTYQTAPTWYVSLMRQGIAWQNAMKLGLVTMGSLAEIGIGLLNPTFQKHYVKAITTNMPWGVAKHTARAIWRDVQPTRARQIAESIGRSVEVEMHDVLTATHAADIQSTASGMIFQLNGLHSFTNMLQDINVAAFEGALKEAVVKRFNDKLGKRKMTDFDRADADVLKMYDIDLDRAMHWYRDGMPMKGDFWDNIYTPALLKYLNDTVMTPRGVNMPRWMSNPWLAPIRHLLTYTTVFANTVVPDAYWNLKGAVQKDSPYSFMVRGQRSAQAMGGVTAMYYLSELSENLLDLWKYGGEEEHPLRDKIKGDTAWEINQFVRFLNRSGVMGLAGSKAFDAFESFHYGRMDYRFIDGAFLTEAAAGTEILMMGVLSGEVDAKRAAKWLVNNVMVPIFAAAVPRGDKALMADEMPTKDEMVKDVTDWLDDHVPGVGKKSSKKFRIH